LELFSDISPVKELIDKAEKIVIIIHTNPDGDALGAGLAVYHFLKQQNKETILISPNQFPLFLSWMPGSEDILVYERHINKAKQCIEESDLIFCLDFNAVNRVDKATESLKNAKAKKILIDHHLYPDAFDYSFSETNTSSTSELIFEFFLALNGKQYLNKAIAECLYVGIVTDTGSFSYACNYEKTYLIIAELYKLGINGEQIHRKVYDTYSENRMRLLGFSLSEKLKVLPQFHAAYIVLTKEELKRFNYQIGDTEGVVNFALAIDGISLAALFMERSDHTKVSFRSKGNFSVDQVARDHFEGGGHRNAAGGNLKVSLEDAIKIFEELLPGYFNELAANV